MSNVYLSREFLEVFGSMSKADLDDLDERAEEIFGVADLDAALVIIGGSVSRLFDAKLTKRYVTPFGLDSEDVFSLARVPEVVQVNVCDVVSYHLWSKRGFNPSSTSDEDAIIGARDRALAWLNEAADAEKGFVELPRRPLEETDVSAITKGKPKVHSEQSPYVWTREQSKHGRDDDRRGSGRMR